MNIQPNTKSFFIIKYKKNDKYHYISLINENNCTKEDVLLIIDKLFYDIGTKYEWLLKNIEEITYDKYVKYMKLYNIKICIDESLRHIVCFDKEIDSWVLTHYPKPQYNIMNIFFDYEIQLFYVGSILKQKYTSIKDVYELVFKKNLYIYNFNTIFFLEKQPENKNRYNLNELLSKIDFVNSNSLFYNKNKIVVGFSEDTNMSDIIDFYKKISVYDNIEIVYIMDTLYKFKIINEVIQMERLR